MSTTSGFLVSISQNAQDIGHPFVTYYLAGGNTTFGQLALTTDRRAAKAYKSEKTATSRAATMRGQVKGHNDLWSSCTYTVEVVAA